MKKWDVFVYGDMNVDLIVPGVTSLPTAGQEELVGRMNTYVGGGAALFALGLGKLGVNIAFKGLIGDDLYGRFISEELKRQGVDASLLKISEKNSTGISISFTNEKDRSFLTYQGTNAEIDIESIETEDVRNARHIHMTSYEGRKNHEKYLSVLKRIRSAEDVSISFDVGWDSSGEWYEGIRELFPYIDVLFMNETEILQYGRTENVREAIEDFSQTCRLVVVKRGKKGSIAAVDGTLYEGAPYPVQAVDTTGAGDSFNAGFIYGYLKNVPVVDCLKYGNGCGAMSVMELGGNTGFPREKELVDFIKYRKVGN